MTKREKGQNRKTTNNDLQNTTQKTWDWTKVKKFLLHEQPLINKIYDDEEEFW
jgi:hypothetical protein